MSISLPVSTRRRMVVSHFSHHIRASAAPARLKAPLSDSPLSRCHQLSNALKRGFLEMWNTHSGGSDINVAPIAPHSLALGRCAFDSLMERSNLK